MRFFHLKVLLWLFSLQNRMGGHCAKVLKIEKSAWKFVKSAKKKTVLPSGRNGLIPELGACGGFWFAEDDLSDRKGRRHFGPKTASAQLWPQARLLVRSKIEIDVHDDAASWALPVFFNFVNNKKWFFVFVIKLIWLGVGFLNRSGAEIGF